MRALEVVKQAGYGAVFVIGIPLLLLAWAHRSAPMIPLPAVGNRPIGESIAAIGLLLLAGGMLGLVHHGRGLPMNAFPPPVFVRQGVFRWLRNPIYLGFGLVVLGTALATRSASGLWLVTPITWLGMAALVFGHERHDLRRRFGDRALTPPLFSLPRASESHPEAVERLAALVWVFGPWLLSYYAVQAIGRPPDAISSAWPGENRWPVVQWMELPYVSAYLFVPLACFAARSRRSLNTFAVSGLVATAAITLCWLLIPVVAGNRPFVPEGLAGRLLANEQSHSSGVAAFPAFHVLWPMLAARAWSDGRTRTWRALAWGWAALIVASCLATGHHTVMDALAGGLLYLPLHRTDRTWDALRRATERLANSWREWRFCRVRFISHGAYAGTAAAVGLLIAGSAAGAGREGAVVWVGLCVLLGAGAYAQVLEGSSALLRPFGWYGGLMGGTLGVLTSPLFGGAVMPLMAAFALAAPWIQLLGRLRCLVQGCCHGGPAPPAAGIVYRHPRSRVAHLAHLAGVPVYPTPLYSIGLNIVLGLILLRLHLLAAPDTLLLGSYFMLSGLARFVEESYRGEPQTPLVGGLRIYQWFAVATLLAGIACTMFPTPPSTAGFSQPTRLLLVAAAGMFGLFSAAMGLDFPASNRRFSRLAAGD